MTDFVADLVARSARELAEKTEAHLRELWLASGMPLPEFVAAHELYKWPVEIVDEPIPGGVRVVVSQKIQLVRKP